MSSTLYWSPLSKIGGSLPYELKVILGKKGSPVDLLVTEATIPYLQGLADAGIHGAEELIDLIRFHGHIKLEEKW